MVVGHRDERQPRDERPVSCIVARMRFVALAVATAALVALTLERARTSRFALGSLWREAFPRHDGTGRKGLHLAWIVAGLAGGAAIVVMPLVAGVMLGAVAIHVGTKVQ